jgi:hypothetical protein
MCHQVEAVPSAGRLRAPVNRYAIEAEHFAGPWSDLRSDLKPT